MSTHLPEIHNQIFRHHAQSKKKILIQNKIKIVNATCHFIPANFCCFQCDKFEASLQEPFPIQGLTENSCLQAYWHCYINILKAYDCIYPDIPISTQFQVKNFTILSSQI